MSATIRQKRRAVRKAFGHGQLVQHNWTDQWWNRDWGTSEERDREWCQVAEGEMGAVNDEGVKASPFTGELAHPAPSSEGLNWGRQF